MCNAGCIIFEATSLTKDEVNGKRVLDVGACDVNGSLRAVVEAWSPAEYVGVDIEAGPGVDRVCSAEDLLAEFGEESFDMVLSSEMLEHVRDWRTVISNFKRVCKPGGVILITTRSFGFAYHGYPHDFWRFEIDDMKQVFADFTIERLEADPHAPGVFIKAKKPENFTEAALADYELYAIVHGERVRQIDDAVLARYRERYARGQRVSTFVKNGIKVVGDLARKMGVLYRNI